MAALADIAIWSFVVSVLQFPNMGSQNLLLLRETFELGSRLTLYLLTKAIELRTEKPLNAIDHADDSRAFGRTKTKERRSHNFDSVLADLEWTN